jgi:hypothetical protein
MTECKRPKQKKDEENGCQGDLSVTHHVVKTSWF